MHTILLTGIGGTRSIAVLKALHGSGMPYRVIGTDANYLNAGALQCDVSYIIPLCSDPGYIPAIESIIQKEGIEIIFATTEKEVTFLASQKDKLYEKHGVHTIVPDSKVLNFCFDKYKTQLFLKEKGLTHIPTIYADNRVHIAQFAKEVGLPLIRKPVFGYGSKGVSIIYNEEQLDTIELDATYVLQQYIENDNDEQFGNLTLNEYTAEVFTHVNGDIAGGIILKRALHSGETIAGYLIKDDHLLKYLKKVATKVGIKGPVNFQFRIKNDKVYIFEINPLFSGTTAIRASLGFNSVHLAVQSFLEHSYEVVSTNELKEEYFMRYLHEIFMAPDKLDQLHKEGYIQNAS